MDAGVGAAGAPAAPRTMLRFIECPGAPLTPAKLGTCEVTCGRGVISPGLINTHDHIGYADTPPQAHGSERYEHRHDWRLGLGNHTRIEAPGNASADQIRAHELRFVMSGVTAAIRCAKADGSSKSG